MSRLEKGQPAPDFRLVDQDGSPVALSDTHGHKRLIVFYPKANTSG